jgi:glycosidase
MSQFEFHVSRRARYAYDFDESLFALDGNVVLADFYAARVFALKLNARRPAGQSVRAGQINALGLIDELQHAFARAYREHRNPGVMAEALDWLGAAIGTEAVETALHRFVYEFPPVAVYKNELTVEEYLADETKGAAHRQAALEEMLMLWLANLNPAFAPFRELFDDAPLAAATAYPKIMAGLHMFFAAQPFFGPDNQNFIDLLRAPALAAPDSLAAQLDFIRAKWGPVLGDLVLHVLGGLDFIREEDRLVFHGPGPAQSPALGPGAQAASLALFGPAGEGGADLGAGLGAGLGESAYGPGAASASASASQPDPEPERFSVDLHWMPHLVLIAKNSYVWLDQLSKKYKRPITRLSEIPDEELDALQRAGITGLWLIGLWERSRASRRIKQMMGNPEAEASAYSLYDYAIAEDLGGDAALQDLKARAIRRGIRLASDMVPNHMGIDSRWVIEHPDWFLSVDRPPFPAYAYNGPDLSGDERVGIQIEDRYYDRADAAVVFKRTDRWTGDARYIYHGNDGTSFPWNDTAQLDYLKSEAREAVIRTILHVARSFPVIRFDAAMTLAKRHFQRLWFPEPGTGGAIPSRSEHGLTKAQFDAAMPEEFWREVVDRVAAEAPDTLLLAEAFWLMEGYFVRTLGMHRVYNSAFMNMLRDEDNAEYRQVMKNTLEFDPEVLKRYVNFMSNPDERTAIEQFGDGDKYFGVCALLATLPGLPMVGHGQIEGFTEKYGMEYRRAYYDETPKPWLVERHERQIFPLFHMRHLFAGVENFLLYDPFQPDGSVDENVIAYSNGDEHSRALVVYHNKHAETRVWLRTSAAYAVKNGASGANGEEKPLIQKDLCEGLRLPDDPTAWVVFEDHITKLEFIRNGRELCGKGLFLELRAYECLVFTDFRAVLDKAGLYAKLAAHLQGGGVPSIEEAALDLRAEPVRRPFRELVNAGFFHWLMAERVMVPGTSLNPEVGRQVEEKARAVARGILAFRGEETGKKANAFVKKIGTTVRRDFEAVLQLPVFEDRFPMPDSKDYLEAVEYLKTGLTGADERLNWTWLFCWAAVRSIGFSERWRVDSIIAGAAREMGVDAQAAEWTVLALKALIPYHDWHKLGGTPENIASQLIKHIKSDENTRRALYVNEYQGITYFNKETFERLLWSLLAIVITATPIDQRTLNPDVPNAIIAAFMTIQILQDAESRSGYNLTWLK